MGPKKDDKKKGAQPVLGAAVVSITEDDLTEAESLPHLNDFVFTNLYAFKMTRNETRLKKQIKKQFQFTSPEDPGYSEEAAVKYKTVEMTQLIGQAQARGLLNEQEAADISKLDPQRRRDVLAQSTVESVTAFQISLRKIKRDEEAAEAEKKKAAADADEPNAAPFTPNPEVKIDQIIYLQDFPKTAEDVKALIKFGFQKLNGVYVIEEIYNREHEDETEEAPAAGGYNSEPYATAGTVGTSVEGEAGAEAKTAPEKRFNKQDERVVSFNEIVEINRIVKKQAEGSQLRHCDVQRLKFEGPPDPMDIPTPPEDGSEPPAIDEERKAAEFKLYDDFATTQKEMMEELAQDLSNFKKQKAEALTMAAPLWPVVRSPEEEARLQALEDLRASQQEALKQKLEEERQAAAAAAAPAKGGKKSAQKGTRAAAEKEPAADAEAEGAQEEEHAEEVAPVYSSTDDDPSRRRDFFEFQKIMSEMETGTATVGSIMAAMVYQIGQNSDEIQKEGLDDKYYEEKKSASRRRLSVADKRETSRALLKANAEDRAMGDVFDSLMEKLQIEHSVLETDFRHVFSNDVVLKDPEQKSSPYMEVKNENDRIDIGASAYRLPDGKPQGATENATLEACPIPGVNKRLGMPKTAAQTRALRESDQDQIIQFCRLPASQTKRCLILRAAEKMMHAKQPERTFSFLDRNYVEEYKDSNTMRQVLATGMNEQQPEVQTQYFENDDGLLVSMFFQNPPGRLLRKQWTHPIRVFPDFPDWRSIVKEQPGQLEGGRLLDISNDQVGALRVNTKFSFPSDNSVIRVDKSSVGQRRMGESKIIKDNFTFGVRERKEVFDLKAQNEDSLRNRDAKEKQDRNCDFWLLFDNGVRLSIEMQEHQEPNMDLVPRADIPAWLKTKLAREKQRQKELDEQSESQIRKSQLAAEEGQQQLDGAASVVGSVMESERRDSIGKAAVDGAADSKPADASGDAVGAQDEKPQEQAEVEPEKVEEEIIEEDDPALKDPSIKVDGQDMTMGSKLTFTFEQGLVVQIQPNGDVMQQFAQNKPLAKSTLKGNNLVQDQLPDNLIEQHRIITTTGEIIKQMADGNFLIYFSDGTLTYSDKRKGIWYTINPVGVKRVRREKDGIVTDEVQRLKIETKIDPETSATLKIREDGVLTVEYVDSTNLIIMPDGTNILRKKRAGGEAGTVTFITKDGFVPIRQTYDPVKARAKTVIGLGGTDALMGKDLIMERTNNGKITEVLLPDNTVVQSYLEKQELEGYNNFSLNMIHIIRRADYSVVKVGQDGEVVLITANERAYLNDIGKQIEELGTKDYDYFFELFGISSERRSGVYTANLNKGRVWTQDEEGNYFIAYANGDSVEKMSVSFDLDQMVDGIENKEPGSPRMKDGHYVEEECKFLPPPKSMAHPRLFYVKNDGSGMELFNEEQLRHMFRSNAINNAEGFIKRANNVKLQNEDCISHVFITKKEKQFNPNGFDVSHEFPKLPQSLDLVNQTVSIPTEPVVEPITYKAVLEFKAMDAEMLTEFHSACDAYDDLKAAQAKLQEDLSMTVPVVITTAAPPTEKKERMRSSDMKSTFLGSDSEKASPRQGSHRGSQGETTSRRLNPQGSKDKNNFELQRGSVDQAEDGATTQAEDDLLIDAASGMQLVKHDLELNHQQKLQLRIANERGINIDNLMGEQYQVLKHYRSLEKRQEIFNNMYDFADGDDGEDSRSRFTAEQ